ncbi:hypothetical protein L596_008855 [Steinernema carpocapsae]|uniref:DDE-1 domain-containing protein n=1 Tax=Steinernema carpocapsae TaxID=34508 RepID=A0A4U5PDY0_STECR|nr:hypothetical protein L596_008855 [Steinernema carpocapsae]
MPVISALGILQLPVLVCFREPKPPAVFHAQLAPFPNIYASYSNSGLMTSAITEHWLEQVFLPNAQRSPTLIVDSWTGYNQAKNVFREQVRFKTVPKKCTNLAQPLDIYFNRQFKAFYRRLSETVIREDEAFIVSQRANVGRLLNLNSSKNASGNVKK